MPLVNYPRDVLTVRAYFNAKRDEMLSKESLS